MKTILVPFRQLDADRIALDAAVALARLFGGHVECLYVHPSAMRLAVTAMPEETDGRTAGAAMAKRWEALKKENRARAAAAGRSFKSFCQRKGIPLTEGGSEAKDASAGWIEAEGDEIHKIVAYAQASDLVVLGRTPSAGHIAKDGIGDILMRAGSPVFLTASPLPGNFPRTVAIAWKDTAEAAHAVIAAMPFLSKAEKVLVFAAAEADIEESAAQDSAMRRVLTLTRRGIRGATPRAIAAGGNVAEALLAGACADNADLLVMGAYGHSRTREFVFGGVTRRILEDAPLPVLLAH